MVLLITEHLHAGQRTEALVTFCRKGLFLKTLHIRRYDNNRTLYWDTNKYAKFLMLTNGASAPGEFYGGL
jgi:hypothetical protein